MDVFSLLHRPSDREQLQRLQTICCRYLAPYGLSLHPTQLQALLQSQRESLLQAGRVAELPRIRTAGELRCVFLTE